MGAGTAVQSENAGSSQVDAAIDSLLLDVLRGRGDSTTRLSSRASELLTYFSCNREGGVHFQPHAMCSSPPMTAMLQRPTLENVLELPEFQSSGGFDTFDGCIEEELSVVLHSPCASEGSHSSPIDDPCCQEGPSCERPLWSTTLDCEAQQLVFGSQCSSPKIGTKRRVSAIMSG
jgi:hypothetical protein